MTVPESAENKATFEIAASSEALVAAAAAGKEGLGALRHEVDQNIRAIKALEEEQRKLKALEPPSATPASTAAFLKQNPKYKVRAQQPIELPDPVRALAPMHVAETAARSLGAPEVPVPPVPRTLEPARPVASQPAVDATGRAATRVTLDPIRIDDRDLSKIVEPPSKPQPALPSAAERAQAQPEHVAQAVQRLQPEHVAQAAVIAPKFKAVAERPQQQPRAIPAAADRVRAQPAQQQRKLADVVVQPDRAAVVDERLRELRARDRKPVFRES
jgi:hypothetical protein